MNFKQALDFFEEEAQAAETPEEYAEVRARIAVLEIMWRQQEPRSRIYFLQQRIKELCHSLNNKNKAILRADKSELEVLLEGRIRF